MLKNRPDFVLLNNISVICRDRFCHDEIIIPPIHLLVQIPVVGGGNMLSVHYKAHTERHLSALTLTPTDRITGIWDKVKVPGQNLLYTGPSSQGM